MGCFSPGLSHPALLISTGTFNRFTSAGPPSRYRGMRVTHGIKDSRHEEAVLCIRRRRDNRERCTRDREGAEGHTEICLAFWGNFAIIKMMRGERVEKSENA